MGGLGPNIGSEEWSKKKEMQSKMLVIFLAVRSSQKRSSKSTSNASNAHPLWATRIWPSKPRRMPGPRLSSTVGACRGRMWWAERSLLWTSRGQRRGMRLIRWSCWIGSMRSICLWWSNTAKMEMISKLISENVWITKKEFFNHIWSWIS